MTDSSGAPPLRMPAERLLMQLKMNGEQTASVLGTALGTTGEAARQHLARLSEQGLVVARSGGSKVGRPAQFWRLTDKGHARFPDTHAALTVELIETLRTTLGEAALDRVIAEREGRSRAVYAERLAQETSLEGRVAALAEMRAAEGYMAESRRQDDGSLLLIENHCPICAAARACQQFCRSEREIFSTALGPEVTIERIEHIVSGARRCAYRITGPALVEGNHKEVDGA